MNNSSQNLKVPDKAKPIALLFIDIFSFYIALVITVILRFGFTKELLLNHIIVFSFLFFFWFLVFYAFQLYDSQKSSIVYYQNYFLALLVNLFLGVLIFYLFGSYFQITPKRVFVLFSIFFLIINFTFRKRIGFTTEKKNVVFVTDAKSLIPEGDIYVVKFQDKKFLSIIEKLLLQGKEVISVSDYNELFFQKISLSEIEKEIFSLKPEINTGLDLIKRIFDLCVAILILIVSLPFWPIIICGIKLSSKGSVFYLDKRIGFQGKVFTLYKFRTLHEKKSETYDDFLADKQKRLFLFGKILRKLHLDELPQLINVIKGDLSLVGPRPDSEHYNRTFKVSIPFYNLRLIVKPGITGWAQIKGSYGDSVEEAKERLEYDLYYIKHRNPVFDLLILLKTIAVIFRGR